MSDTFSDEASGVTIVKKKHGGRRLIIIGLVTLALFVGGFFVWSMLQKNDATQTKTSVSVCDDAILSRAKSAIDKGDSDALNEVVSEIYTKTGYDQDKNCLYVINTYGTLIGTVNETLVATFAEQYDENAQLSPTLGASTERVASQQSAWKSLAESQSQQSGTSVDTSTVVSNDGCSGAVCVEENYAEPEGGTGSQ